MSTMKSFSWEELKALPIMTAEQLDEVALRAYTPDPDCPILTREQLSQFRPGREVHPEWFKNESQK